MKELLIYLQKDKYDKLMKSALYYTGYFTLIFNTTDHFSFECAKCKGQAEIVKVFCDDDSGTPCIYFLLICEKCKRKGQRKIYLEDYIVEIEPKLSATFGIHIYDASVLEGYLNITGTVCDDMYSISFALINISYYDECEEITYYWDETSSSWDTSESSHLVYIWAGGGTSSNPYLWRYTDIPETELAEGQGYLIRASVTNSIGQTSTHSYIFHYGNTV